ncbi:MAG: acyltransferase [Acidobacteria bacterium]|nr:acyltransferase [Acidobacteriota bacterium]
MATRPLDLENTDVKAKLEAWLQEIDARICDPGTDRNALCVELARGFYGLSDAPRNIHEEVLHLNLDPRNATTEAEYYSEIDPEKWAPVKPLTWLWQMFDNSPLNANVWLGLKFRAMLAPHIFKSVGQNVKFFTGIEWSFGYNISLGDDVVIHRFVLLDDRGSITIKKKASISDYANIYSHWHDLVDPSIVYLGDTVIGEGARVTYHSTVLSGTKVGDYAMVGTGGLVTKDVPDYTVSIGLPAHPARLKPNAPAHVAAPSEQKK